MKILENTARRIKKIKMVQKIIEEEFREKKLSRDNWAFSVLDTKNYTNKMLK